MTCQLTEQDLWSGLDKESPEVLAHVATCEDCRARAGEFRASMNLIKSSGAAQDRQRRLPKTIGPYAITRFLGEGGMGIVYEGRQQTPERLVAVKVMRGGEHVDETRIRLFVREAQTLARLKHPWIASIYEAGWTEDRQPFFVMELVEGPPLKGYADEHKLPLRKRLELFRRVCEAVAHAHQRGVIHRDLKPSNILIDEEGNPKVLDFGLARIMDSEVARSTLGTEMGKFLGTLPYMSPEAVQGDIRETDVRSDVYSLGVVLYELLTGALPHMVTRSRLAEAIRVICEEVPPKPSLRNRALRGDLDTIILKALEKDPDRRYQSVDALSDDLWRYLTDQPITARQLSLVYELRKLMARHRTMVVFAAMIVLGTAGARMWIERIAATSNTRILMEKRSGEIQQVIDLLDYTSALHKQGAYEAAEPKYKRALEYTSALQYEGKHRLMAMCWEGLGSLLVEQGEPARLNEAAELLDSAMGYHQSLGSPASKQMVKEIRGWQLLNEAQRQQCAGDADAAEKSYREALSVFHQVHPNDARYRTRAALGLASLLVQRGDAESGRQAKELLASALVAYQSDPLRQGHRLEYDGTLVLQSINEGRLAQLAGDDANAAQRYRKALDDAINTMGPAHRFTNWARCWLGALLVRRDREGEAPAEPGEGEKLLLLARDAAEAGPLADRITLVAALEGLRWVYRGSTTPDMEKRATVLEALRPLYAEGPCADADRNEAVIAELRSLYGPAALNEPEALEGLASESTPPTEPDPQ